MLKKEGAAMTFNLSHARHDTAHCLAPGLFQSFKRGDKKGQNYKVIYEYGGNQTLEFYCFEPLNDLDMRVLQGLIAMSGPNGVILNLHSPKSEAGRQLSIFLEPKFDALEDNSMVIKNTFYSLAKEIGYKDPNGTRTRNDIKKSIERMWHVSIIARKGTFKRGFRLLSEYASDEEDKRLFVALNPLVTEALLGERQYTHISMNEVRALKTPAARLIHQRLCGFINAGKKHLSPIYIDTLSSYVWPSEASNEAIKKRRQKVKKGLKELSLLHWEIEEVTKNNFTIKRPEK